MQTMFKIGDWYIHDIKYIPGSLPF